MINCIVAGVIAIICYEISAFIGATLNVLVSYSVGFPSYNDLLANINVATLILLFLIGLLNHVFFSWLTASVIKAYGKKEGCLSLAVYTAAMIAVLIASFIINPLLLSKRAGWLSSVAHPIMLFLFGYRTIHKKENTKMEKRQVKDTSEVNYIDKEQDISTVSVSKMRHQEYLFCHECGNRLPSDSEYCSNCGAKMPIVGGK